MMAEPQRTEDGMSRLLPLPGHDWPCQTIPRSDLPPKLVAFLYRVLRDGASAPSDVEGHAIQAGRHTEDPAYTNGHLEMYARALATYLVPVPDEAAPDEAATTA